MAPGSAQEARRAPIGLRRTFPCPRSLSRVLAPRGRPDGHVRRAGDRQAAGDPSRPTERSGGVADVLAPRYRRKTAAPSPERPSRADNDVRRHVEPAVDGGPATPQPASPATAGHPRPPRSPASSPASRADVGRSRGGAAACRPTASRLRRPIRFRWRAVARRDRSSASSRRSLANHGPGKTPAAMTALEHYRRCFVPGFQVTCEAITPAVPRPAPRGRPEGHVRHAGDRQRMGSGRS